jgi:chromosomal replication initiator protein
VKNVKREISIDYIQKLFQTIFNWSRNLTIKKQENTLYNRQLAMFFAKKFTKASLANIGSQIETEITQQYCMPVKPLII